MDRFGACVGTVFQITDDLLDAEGTREDTGKEVKKDDAAGKATLVPSGTYRPINHRMAVTRTAEPATTALFDYLLSEPAQAVFRAWGLAPPP